MSANAVRMQPQSFEGIAVVGEAVRRVAPESAEFLVEITASGQTVTQAMANHQSLMTQIAQGIAGAGVHRGDLQTVSMNVANAYAPALAMPSYGVPQIAPGGFPGAEIQSAPTRRGARYGSRCARRRGRARLPMRW